MVSQYTDDEYNSLDYLKYYRKYLDENRLNKLLQVIYNSGNEETINDSYGSVLLCIQQLWTEEGGETNYR